MISGECWQEGHFQSQLSKRLLHFKQIFMNAPNITTGTDISAEIPHFSVVVLCYRSSSAVIPIVQKLHDMLSLLNFKWEILLVGNYIEGSDDDTPLVVKSLENKLSGVRSIALPKQGMMGWDMRVGLDMAKGKYIAVIDGDGQFPLESLVSCLLKIESENLDLVKTYRVRRDDGFYRRAISLWFNFIFRLLFKIDVHDVNSKPKLILRSKYQNLELKSDDWFIDTEIMIQAKAANLSIGEIPIHFYAISERASFVKPSAILEFSRNLFRYRFRRTKKPSGQTIPKATKLINQ